MIKIIKRNETLDALYICKGKGIWTVETRA